MKLTSNGKFHQTVLFINLTVSPVLTLVKFPSSGKSQIPSHSLPPHFSSSVRKTCSKASVSSLLLGTAIRPPNLRQSSIDFLKDLFSGMTVGPGTTGLQI